MYRVYVVKQRPGGGSQVQTETRTETAVFPVAAAAFWELFKRPYDATHLLLMTKDGRQINAYRYGSIPGERDYVEPESQLRTGDDS